MTLKNSKDSTIEITISESIIDQINSLEDKHTITAFNNDITPFQLVFYILHVIVPLSQEDAYNKTLEIHMFGKSSVYTGSLSHCEKIGDAFKKIKVDYVIE